MSFNIQSLKTNINYSLIEQKALNYHSKQFGIYLFHELEEKDLLSENIICHVSFEFFENPVLPDMIFNLEKREISVFMNNKQIVVYKENKDLILNQELAEAQVLFLKLKKHKSALSTIYESVKYRLDVFHLITEEYVEIEEKIKEEKELQEIEKQKAIQIEQELLLKKKKEEKKRLEEERIKEEMKIKTEEEKWNCLKQNIMDNVIQFSNTKTTTVKLDVSGLMSYSFDNENRIVILKEVTSSFNSNKKYTHIFKYDVGTKLAYYSMNNEPQDIENLYMSIDCSHEFKQLCDTLKDYLDRKIDIDEDLLKEIQKASIIQNNVIDINKEKGKFEPFKKTHIE